LDIKSLKFKSFVIRCFITIRLTPEAPDNKQVHPDIPIHKYVYQGAVYVSRPLIMQTDTQTPKPTHMWQRGLWTRCVTFRVLSTQCLLLGALLRPQLSLSFGELATRTGSRDLRNRGAGAAASASLGLECSA